MSQSSYSLGQYVSACEYNFQFRYCPKDINKKNKGICLELCTIYLSLMLMNISSERILYNLQDVIMNPKTAAPDDTMTETYLNKYMKVINDYPSPLEEIIKNIEKILLHMHLLSLTKTQIMRTALPYIKSEMIMIFTIYKFTILI